MVLGLFYDTNGMVHVYLRHRAEHTKHSSQQDNNFMAQFNEYEYNEFQYNGGGGGKTYNQS